MGLFRGKIIYMVITSMLVTTIGVAQEISAEATATNGISVNAEAASTTVDTNEIRPAVDLHYIPPPARTNFVDIWHAKWSSNVLTAARYLDNFFADPRLDEESNGTRLKLSVGGQIKEGEKFDVINKVNLRLQLPRTSKRLQLVFEDLVESDNPGAPSDIINDFSDSNPDASLRYNLSKKKRFKLDADAGLRLGDRDQYFIRLRGERRFDITENLRMKLTESVRWYSRDGWVSLTQLQFDQQLAWDLLFRFKSELEWPEEEFGVTPTQTLSFFKTMSKRRALRWDIGGTWPNSPNPSETVYYTSVTFRRLVYRDWLYAEFTPGVEFPQEDDYGEKFFVRLQFDMVLGGLQ